MSGLIQFVKFCMVGFSNTMITYTVYYALTFVGLPYVVAYTAGFILGVVNAFYWNNKFVFGTSETRNLLITFLRMTAVYSVIGFFLSNFLLIALIERLSISKYVAPVFILILTIPLNFLLNKFWSFKAKGDKK